MNVDIDPEEVKTAKTDSRGRLYLGADYADADVEVAVLSTDDECNDPGWLKDKFEDTYGTRDLDEAKRRAEVHEEWYDETS